ncbi:MAG: copper resistance protein [Sarea resinae]|nr:MAG: copper resistance protein [Sarea resinae]
MFAHSLAGLCLIAGIFAPVSYAQTSSSCNPTEKTGCPADTALSTRSFSSDFTSGSLGSSWNTTAGKVTFGSDGAEFTVAQQGDAPTIETDFYFFFGTVETVVKAAPGKGIVSSVVLESDDLDEVDWEFTGTNTSSCETNYFGKGNTANYDRSIYYPVTTPQDSFHTYTVNWTTSSITWSIDGNVVRTLASSAANSGSDFPQTPMRVKIGIWAGGDPTNSEGTIEWAGGETDYSSGPYTMYVKSVKIENSSPANKYSYKDTTGDWQSIDVEGGSANSDASSASAASTATSASGSTASGTATSGSAGVFATISHNATNSSTGSKSSSSNTSAASSSAAVATKSSSSAASRLTVGGIMLAFLPLFLAL